MPTGTRFAVLGEVRAWRGEASLDLGPMRQRAVLAVLLLHAGQQVSSAKILDAVWGECPPASGEAVVHSYVSRLRRVLEPGLLTNVRGGYRLDIDRGRLDLTVAEATLAEADRAAAAGDWDRAADLLGTVLAAWEPEALAGIPGDFAETQRQHLAERRLGVLEARFDAELHRGRHAQLVPELTELVARYPLRERLLGMLMLVLYRTGRQADALHEYQLARKRLTEELGIDPGRELRELHQAILTNDPALTAPAAQDWSARKELPGDIVDFSGRAGELDRLLSEEHVTGGAVVISAIDGMAGIGKTALAVHAAHRLAPHYPDGQLFLDLHGHTPGQQPVEPMIALDVLLRAAGVPSERIPGTVAERAALWRATLADRRAIVVLDNAASAAQVRPLLPGGSGCLTMITSRRRLSDLDTTRTVSLDVLSVVDATGLFALIIGVDRAATEPDAVAEVVELCGRLPLAIRIAGGRLRSRPAWTVAHLAQRMRDRHRLHELVAGDRNVSTAFALSYQQLEPRQQRFFRLLGLLPGADADAYTAAALTASTLDDAEELLEALVDVHLLQQPTPGHYQFHDLVREHARGAADQDEPATERRQAVHRMLDYYLHTADQASRYLVMPMWRITPEFEYPPAFAPVIDSGARALTWCEAERANITATIGYAATSGWPVHAYQFVEALWGFYYVRGNAEGFDATLRTLRFAADNLSEYPQGRASMLAKRGHAAQRLGRYHEAIEIHTEALGVSQDAGDDGGVGAAMNNIANAESRLGRYDDALAHYEQALTLRRSVEDRWCSGETMNNIARVHARLGRYDKALEYSAEALVLAREVSDLYGTVNALLHLGSVYRLLGRYDEAKNHHQQALAVARGSSDRSNQSDVLNELGELYRDLGRFEEARACHTEALDIAAHLFYRYQEARAHEGIGHTLAVADPEAARRHWARALAIYTEITVPEAAGLPAHLERPVVVAGNAGRDQLVRRPGRRTGTDPGPGRVADQ